jgi:hypothetical protein
MGAGLYREKLRFEARALDRHGEPSGPFAPRFDQAARVVFLKSGETVLGQRLKNKALAQITLRASRQAREISSAWRAVNVRTGDRFDLKDSTLTEKRNELLFVAELQGADGGESTEADA